MKVVKITLIEFHLITFDESNFDSDVGYDGAEFNSVCRKYSPSNFLCRVTKRQLSTALSLVSRLFRSCSLLP